jgi:hypothetical protein
MSTVTGDDDGSFPMTLPFSLQLGNTEYNQIYYSTNGLMSFGQPDGNFWSYPQTPSVTLAGRDWVSFGPGAYTSYGYNENSFCIEWSVRPFPQSSGDLTQIRLVVNRFANGGWHGEITTLGWIPPDIRRGIVWEQNGIPLPIEAAFDVNGGVPVEVEPAPAPTSFTEPPAIPTQCWDGSTVYAPATCPSTPPDITCWNGEIVPWNGLCQQVPPPIECWNGTSVNWNEQCPTRTLNPPLNVIGEVRADGVYVSWDPPYDPFTSAESYAISWQCNGCAGYGWSSNSTSVLIPFSTFGYTGGTGREYTFSVRADNNTNAIYSSNTVGPTLFVQEPIAIPEPQPSVSPEPTIEPSPQPSQPAPQPSEPVVQPSEIYSPIPTPSESQLVVPEPEPSPILSLEPEPSSPSEPTLDPEESPTPDPSPEATDLPFDNDITDGLTAEEAIALEELLTEYGPMDAISFESFEESGLDYEDLPPDQPVMLENGVILTAEVADAIEMFEDPSELLLTILTDPGKALTAVANIGADMTPEQREESQIVVVASIIVGQVISTTNLITGRIR